MIHIEGPIIKILPEKSGISIDAREWQGRWFNTVTGYNLQKLK